MDEDSRILIDDVTCLSNDGQIDETQIKQYKKQKLLGVGSYGKAYLVTSDDENQINYVMKVLPQSASAKQEASILQNLRHENIIEYVETFIDSKNRLCLIMEYANNGTLGQYLKSRQQQIPETQIIDLFTQLCLAIQYVHSQKIIHRDIKAENVFLHETKLKLGDFGVARSVQKTLATTFIGTPYYLSPEIIQNQPYSYKSDIWALGVLLYEMCTFKYPFQAESLPALATKIVKGKIQPISAQFYSQNMKNLIQNLLQIDPNKRPSIEQILQNILIQNRIKQLNIKQQPITKTANSPIQNKQQHYIIIKKDEYKKQKQLTKDEQSKAIKQDVQKKKCLQQKPQEVIVELFGQLKKQEQISKNVKKKDIPVEIYLPFMSQIEQKQQQINSAQEKMEEQLIQSQQLIQQQQQRIDDQNNNKTQKQIPRLTYEKAEKIRQALEKGFGSDQFLNIYNTFRNLREKNSLEEIAKQYGPNNYRDLIPNIQQEFIPELLPSLFLLLEFDLDE
ncbi:unnamed protein product [Paramecium sonneborni]|uniref:non-specific serine/threonine protein kinase n=1 Tax=Paramecium sonneborni TaxID=65129 RepID=A0A8S1LQA6_9CILI|nr:unnamed protein product [Paramecium sonneborni]